MGYQTDNSLENLEQQTGNYNVFCQSCGQLIGLNIQSQQKAFQLEEKHAENTGCKYTGSHIIRKQETKNPDKSELIL